MDHHPNLFHVIGDWWDHRQAKRRAATFLPPSPRLSRWLPTRGNVLFTLLMIALLLWAQTAGALPLGRFALAPSAPSTSTIAYQGRLADASGNPLTQTVNMTFRLYNVAAGGGEGLWAEDWIGPNGVQVSDGLFNVMLGSLEPIPAALITSNSSLFLGITVDTDDEMAPRVQLGTVPFAVQALTVPDGSITAAKFAADVSLEPPDGSITTAKIADGAVTQEKLAASMDFVPTGAIILWSGAVNAVPTGWRLCDGSNSTPDLRDRFVVGAGNSYAVGATGGAAQVTLTINQIPVHSHSYTDRYTTGERESGSHAWDATNDKNPKYNNDGRNTGSAGGGQEHENRPPYYALAYICKQ